MDPPTGENRTHLIVVEVILPSGFWTHLSSPFFLSSSDVSMPSFFLRSTRGERKRWENVLAGFVVAGSSRTHDSVSVRGRAGTPIAGRNGTGKDAQSGTGRTRSISGPTTCKRSLMVFRRKRLPGFIGSVVDLPPDYPRGKFKR